MKRLSACFQQFGFLSEDMRRIVRKGGWWRYLSVCFTPSFTVIATYRICRALFLLLGPVWNVWRILAAPLAWLLRPWFGRCEIHYAADLGPGLTLLHPSLGVVISAHTVAGARLILTGGNCIGLQHGGGTEKIRLGGHITLGANAVILGPLTLGDHVKIGAGAVVTRGAADGTILVGVPARPLKRDLPLEDSAPEG